MKIAKELSIDKRAIGSFAKGDLNYKSYMPKRRYLLTVPVVTRIRVSLVARLQPFNSFVWAVLKKDVNSWSNKTNKARKVGISDVLANKDRIPVTKACSSFGSHLENMVARSSDFYTFYMFLTLYKVSLKYVHLVYKNADFVIREVFLYLFCTIMTYNIILLISLGYIPWIHFKMKHLY